MNETALLLRMKARMAWHGVCSVRQEPFLKKAVITLFILLWVVGGFCLMREGITFIAGFPGIGDYLIQRLLYLFALGVAVMLVFSNILLAYSVLYERRENTLLFSLPIPHRAVVACKVWETMLLSSWAFLLMAVPLTMAYFVGGGLGAGMFVLSWFFLVPLAALCGAVGLMIALLAGRYVPRARRSVGKAIVIAMCAAAAFVVWRRGGDGPREADERLRFVNQIVSKSRFASCVWLPSSWAADGIVALGHGRHRDAAFHWALLVSNAMFAYALCMTLGELLLAAGADRAHGHTVVEKGTRAFRWIGGRSPSRSLAAKDVITFCRDPGQWGQFALFFGLLGIYILNLRHLPYDLGSIFWKYLLFMMNLSAMGFTLAGLSSRFFFPLISLELKGFWFLRLSPSLGVREIVREKYLLCVSFVVGVTGLLALLSGVMLGVAPLLLASSLAGVLCMGIAIAGLSVGLGGLYPNPRAASSAEVVSGLGGTMVLVLTTLYICGALFIQALPLYGHVKKWFADSSLPLFVVGSICILGVISASVAAVALRAGRRRLETMDL